MKNVPNPMSEGTVEPASPRKPQSRILQSDARTTPPVDENKATPFKKRKSLIPRPPKDTAEYLEPKLSEAEAFAAEIIDNPKYRAQLKHRAITGTLPPGIEALLWYYRFGRPVRRVEISKREENLSALTNQQFASKISQLEAKVKELDHMEKALGDKPTN